MVQPQEFPAPLLESISKARKVLLELYPLDVEDHRTDSNDSIEEIFKNHLAYSRESVNLERQLSPAALRILEDLLEPDDFDTALSLKPGAVAMMIRPAIARRTEQYRIDFFQFLTKAQTNGNLLKQIDTRYLPYIPTGAIAEMTRALAGEDQESLWNYLLNKPEDPGEKLGVEGVDRLIAQVAQGSQRDIVGLDDLEPHQSHLDLALTLINAADLNRLLMAASKRLNPKLGAVYFMETILSNQMFKTWNKRLYFSDLDVTEVVAKIENQYHGLLSDFEVLPGLAKINWHDWGRHKYWVPNVAAEIKQGNAFIAVGMGHLVRHRDGTPSLLEQLKSLGFKVTPWSEASCTEILRKLEV